MELKLITIKEYCEGRPLNVAELIQRAVNEEDAINHRGEWEHYIPSDLEYPKIERVSKPMFERFKRALEGNLP